MIMANPSRLLPLPRDQLAQDDLLLQGVVDADRDAA
jgi:hypothetical protein